MIGLHVRMARTSIASNRLRSFLTVVGIIIGVASVVTIVSLGEGVKRDVSGEIRRLGDRRLSVRPGQALQRDKDGNITGVSIASTLGASTLTEKDIDTIRKTPGVATVSPVALIAGTPSLPTEGAGYTNAYVAGVSEGLPEILDKNIAHGSFFESEDKERNLAVIGSNVAEQLFGEEAPIGQTLDIRGSEFIVRGVFEPFKGIGFELLTSYNDAVFIPYLSAKNVNDGTPEIRDIEILVEDWVDVEKVASTIKSELTKNHNGHADFTVLKQSEFLDVTDSVFDLLTRFVAAIAAISLFVGGIGIMNIMLVSVTERTREIGVRKALGATNRQILGQFIVEAIMLSLVGGIVGIVVGGILAAVISLLTSFGPYLTLEVVGISLLMSVVVGIIFGITPALKAARKDPIEALRYE